ncbi:UPF0606 protein KIAA1549 isoform X2 [Tachysurus ichikawai]
MENIQSTAARTNGHGDQAELTEKLPSGLSKRDSGFFPTHAGLQQALLSLSQYSENPRSKAHTSSDAKHLAQPVRHDNASGIAPTPSLGADGGSGKLGDSAHGIHLLLRPPDLLTPSQMPPLHGHSPPTPAPPTLLTHEDLDSAQSTEVDWGSGDYLETLTFMGSDGDDLSLVTTLPTHGYDSYEIEDDNAGVRYNTDFPSRPVLTLSSGHLLPSATLGYGTSLRTAHPSDPRLPHVPDPAQDDLDFDWAELYPIEPTEMLLPDMNSMEYYNTLLAKENASAARNQTHLTPPHITPTATHTQLTGSTHTLTPSLGVGPNTVTEQVDKPHSIPGVTPTPPQKPTVQPAGVPSYPAKGSPRPALPDAKEGSEQPVVPSTPPVIPHGPVIQAVTVKVPSAHKPQTPTKAMTSTTTTTTTMSKPVPPAPRIPLPIAPRQYVCNITKQDMYLVRVGMPSATSVAFAKAHVKEILRQEFNRTVELQVLKAPPNFVFRAVSGPNVYTAVSIINTLRQSARSTSSSTILTVTPIYPVPEHINQVHSVLQFVPSHVDVRVCSFSERVERGLFMAYSEVRRRLQENGNFSVLILNITVSLAKGQKQQKTPVDITFAIRDSHGYLRGSDVSAHLRQLHVVEFSFYLGFPAVQIAERATSGSGADEQLSSSSIFDHVDRLSRGSSDGTRRVSNKVQLIAMQPVPSPPSHPHNQALSPALSERMADGGKVSSEVALRHKSEIEHHRNKIRLRAKRKGHYEFPSMEDIIAVFGDSSEQQRVYQQAQEQIHKILHPNTQIASPNREPHRRGRRSPRQRQRQNLSGNSSLTDKDRLISDGDATYRKYPGVNNVAYVSDADRLPDVSSPSPTDEVFVDPGSPPPGPAPAPPAYIPPQPSIEEARQQMHSLLDDAFALVSPSSQISSAPLNITGVTTIPGEEGVSPGLPSSPPPRSVRQWGSSSYPAAPAHSPFSARYAELGMSPTSVQNLLHRQTMGSGYLASGELQSDPGYTSSGQYGDDISSSSRPRPVGGSTGAQLHQLTQVGLSSQIAVYPGVGRSVSGPSGSSWAQYRSDEEVSRPGNNPEAILSFPEYSSSPVFQMPRSSLRDPPMPTAGYSGLEEASPAVQSSASLIKAIREELQRLSQKQPAMTVYHS